MHNKKIKTNSPTKTDAKSAIYFAATFFATATILAIASCSDLCENIVQYEVTGKASSVTAEFNNEYGDTERLPIALPWIKKFAIQNRSSEYYGGSYPGGVFLAYIKAQVTSGYGSSICVAIYVNGEKVAADTGNGNNSDPTKVIATARYTVKVF